MFALRRLNSAMAAQPLVTSLVVTGAKAAVVDVMVQTVIEGRKRDVDQRRVCLFAAFGFAYQGAFQYWLINHVWERAFPGRTWRAVAAKVVCMNAIGASADVPTVALVARSHPRRRRANPPKRSRADSLYTLAQAIPSSSSRHSTR